MLAQVPKELQQRISWEHFTHSETGEQPVMLQTVSFVVCLVYGVRKILCRHQMSKASRRLARVLVTQEQLLLRNYLHILYLKITRVTQSPQWLQLNCIVITHTNTSNSQRHGSADLDFWRAITTDRCKARVLKCF